MWKGNKSSPSADRAARLEHAKQIGRPLQADEAFESHPKVKAFYAEPETQAAMALLRDQGQTVTERSRLGRKKEVEQELAVIHVLDAPVGNPLFLSGKGLLMRNEMDIHLNENERYYPVPGRDSGDKIDFDAVRASVRQFLAQSNAGTSKVGHIPDDFNLDG